MKILTTTLKSLTILFAAAGLAFAQTPSAKTAPDSTNPVPKSASSPAAAAAMTTPATAATTTTTSAMPSAEEMKKMMELSMLNDNHKLLAATAGNWTNVVKMWMDPKGAPTESKGTAVRKAVMDGRYVTGDYTGSFKMPGADGKMKDMNFKGMSLDGYDNVKQKFVSGWVDNMGTGIYITEGTYDASAKTITYTGEFEMMPGMKTKVREVIKLTDKDHMSMEYFEDRGQGEAKSMEINYTRKK
ncbi:MAG: hypothetical protein QOJ05_944 [Verrucomicrobiota bacterium]|jgi:hypothetical protein